MELRGFDFREGGLIEIWRERLENDEKRTWKRLRVLRNYMKEGE